MKLPPEFTFISTILIAVSLVILMSTISIMDRAGVIDTTWHSPITNHKEGISPKLLVRDLVRERLQESDGWSVSLGDNDQSKDGLLEIDGPYHSREHQEYRASGGARKGTKKYHWKIVFRYDHPHLDDKDARRDWYSEKFGNPPNRDKVQAYFRDVNLYTIEEFEVSPN